MLNVNIGGTKKWDKVHPDVRARWKVLDIAGRPDFRYDLNSGERFPIKTGMVDTYYSSHTLEHIHPRMLPFVLGEIYQTLKKGGRVRVVVPDVKLAIHKYIRRDKLWLRKAAPIPKIGEISYPKTMLGHLMTWFYSMPKGHKRSGHNIVFDWETLVYYFKQAKFINIYRSNYGQGSKVFDGLDFLRHKDKSLYLEASK